MNKVISLCLLSGLLVTTGCAASLSGKPQPEEKIAAASDEIVPVATPADSGGLTGPVLFDLLLGELAGQRGQYNLSVKALSRAAFETRDARVAERATQVAVHAKRYADALKTAELWAELQPENLEAREVLGEVLMELGRPEEARAHFERIVAGASANNSNAFLKIAARLSRQQNRTEALALMTKLVALKPELPEAHFALAHLAVRASELDQALTAIDRTLALRADWEDAAVFKARILVTRKDMPEALAFYEQFLATHPKATDFRLNYARYLVDLKQWDKALGQFQLVVEQKPEDPDSAYAVGLLAMQTNRLDEAEKYLQRVLTLQPENDQARLYLGQVAEQRKNWDAALKWYREVSAGGYVFEARAREAMVTAKQGDLDAARMQLHTVQPESDQQRVQLVLAEEQILREAKRYRDAFDVLTKALMQLPGEVDLLYARALIAEKLDMLDEHERDLRALLVKDPKNAHALNALGYTLADRTTRYQEALELLQQAVALKPDDAFILDSLGWVQYRLNNHREAIRLLQRALSLRNDAEIAAHLGEVLWVTGDRAGAESVWSKALKETPDSEVLQTVIKKFKQ